MVALKTPKQKPVTVALSNQSKVFEAFGENEKLTITEVVARLNENVKPHEQLSDRTIRRSIEALVKSGFLKPYGKANNAMTYGKLSASFVDTNEKLINFNGELVSIEDFLRLMVDPDSKPLQRGKNPILSDEVNHTIRRRLAGVVISAGNAGMHEYLQKVQRELFNVLADLNYTTGVLQAFMDSPVWYEQYRDKMAYGMRRVQENDADLIQLAYEYMNGG